MKIVEGWQTMFTNKALRYVTKSISKEKHNRISVVRRDIADARIALYDISLVNNKCSWLDNGDILMQKVENHF